MAIYYGHTFYSQDYTRRLPPPYKTIWIFGRAIGIDFFRTYGLL